MTHAIVDGIRGYFMEQTNPDVAGFHEAFADVVALFRHFSHTEVLLDAIQRTGGNLFEAQLPLPPPSLMAPAKKAPAKKTAAKKAPARKPPAAKAPDTLRVRMYRVGFGDFFLITVPSDAGPQHILVDCGVFRGTSQKGDIATIKTAVRHMVAETGSKLALLVVTHRHADHIIGFSRCATEFRTFKDNVGAIWMSTWETEYEPKVQKFQQDLVQLANNIGAALAGGQDPMTADIQSVVENATGEGPGGGTNAKSLKLIKTELGVKPQYLAKGDTPKLPAALSNAGLTAEILGPPPVGEDDYLKLMDLKKGIGQYLDIQDDETSTQRLMPFGRQYVATADDYPVSAFREWRPRTEAPTSTDFQKRYPAELRDGVRTATPAALLTAAKTLNDNLNNQSLVVLFGWKGKTLLFAGDAQGGNWEYWLYGAGAPAKDPSDLTLSSEGAEVLRDIDFYKIGHHGSTNATPIPAEGDGQRIRGSVLDREGHLRDARKHRGTAHSTARRTFGEERAGPQRPDRG